jgi:23S rRNA G2445 N2-methylase RlmL
VLAVRVADANKTTTLVDKRAGSRTIPAENVPVARTRAPVVGQGLAIGRIRVVASDGLDCILKEVILSVFAMSL